MSAERIVIVGYKPFPGKENQLHDLLKKHVEILRNEGLASDRKPVIMKASDGTFLEVFGWKSKESIDAAHTNIAVQKLWDAFQDVCEYVPVGRLDESKDLFSEFAPVS